MSRLSIFTLFLSLGALADAPQPLPSVGIYARNGESHLNIKNASAEGIEFELFSINPYRSSTCSAAGKAQLSAPGAWTYVDSENQEECRITLTKSDPNSLAVNVEGCEAAHCGAGASLESGTYALDSCRDFPARSRKLGQLNRAKKFSEALKWAQKIASECASTLDENSLGALHADLAWLQFRNGQKGLCLKTAQAGIESLGLASKGLKALKEARDTYRPDGESRKNACRGALPGCRIFSERIKIYQRLVSNQKLCR